MGAEYTIEEVPNDYNETKHGVRIFFLILTLISNIFLFGFTIFKVFVKKEKSLNIILTTAMFYISCTIFAALYNLLYRFTISITACKSSDIFEELTIAFTRSMLLLFYVIMITKVFENSKQAINKIFRNILIAIIIVIHMVTLPVIFISSQKYHAYKTPSYGIYCNNQLNSKSAVVAVILYHLLDFGITVILCALFLHKLRQLLHDLRSNDSTQQDDDDENEMIQQRNAKEKLLRLVKKSMILTLISVISSWIIIFGGKMDAESQTFIRWIYPLDYVFNGWCVFLFFDWKEFQCLCLKNKEVTFDEDDVNSIGDFQVDNNFGDDKIKLNNNEETEMEVTETNE